MTNSLHAGLAESKVETILMLSNLLSYSRSARLMHCYILCRNQTRDALTQHSNFKRSVVRPPCAAFLDLGALGHTRIRGAGFFGRGC
eukprot:6186362-Pleurochrysis_carterae.AAC.1